ncbi:MAG: hypothetical protein K2M40_08475 [Muribaculaceae bacterium]|nr:hypothetical protein [Muribaculaceae bacterium]
MVHQNHGIGLYAGIQRLDLHGVVKDYLKITYEKGDVLYVPVTQLDLLSRYTAPGDSDRVKLARLGSTEWVKTRRKVRAAAREMAKELIELYARRRQARGTAFPEDSEWQRDFEARFEYAETDDQLRSAAEIKKDMEKPWPMDRLLCGDVGVGKTEVALRAVFKCIMGGKQCALLAPTTLLAPIVQICDAISGARPGARREIVEAYLKRLNDLEQLALSYPGVIKTYAIQAGRELRVIVGADKIDDAETEKLSAEIAQKIQDEMTYPGQVKITVIRETRSVAFAK